MGSILTYLAARLKLKYEGISASEAGRAADRLAFRQELLDMVREAREEAGLARQTARERETELELENDKLRKRISELENEVHQLRQEFRQRHR